MDSKLTNSIDETMGVLGISRTYVYRLIERGEIDRVHIGRRAFILTASIAAYLARLSAQPDIEDNDVQGTGARLDGNGDNDDDPLDGTMVESDTSQESPADAGRKLDPVAAELASLERVR